MRAPGSSSPVGTQAKIVAEAGGAAAQAVEAGMPAAKKQKKSAAAIQAETTARADMKARKAAKQAQKGAVTSLSNVACLVRRTCFAVEGP
jgi:hypothetical protein